MDIRICRQNEIEQIKDIWRYCFTDGEEYIDFYFREKFNKDDVVVAIDGEKVVGAIHLNRHTISVRGKNIEMSYIVGVSTLPEARGTGVMKHLMRVSLNEIERRNQSLSILMPIDFRLYRRYGFENCYDAMDIEIDIFELGKFRIKGNFKKAEENMVIDMVEIYRVYTKEFNGYALRDEKYFRELLHEKDTENGHVYINYRDDKPTGYVYYYISDGNINVREIYYADFTAYESILKFIFNHNTQAKNVKISVPVYDHMRMRIDNPNNMKSFIKPFMMGRVIDFEKAIDVLKIRSYDDDVSLVLRITDDILENNDSTFIIKNINGYLKAEKSDSEYMYSLTVNEAAQLLFGYCSLKDILELKDVHIEDDSYENRIFKVEKNYINEYV